MMKDWLSTLALEQRKLEQIEERRILSEANLNTDRYSLWLEEASKYTPELTEILYHVASKLVGAERETDYTVRSNIQTLTSDWGWVLGLTRTQPPDNHYMLTLSLETSLPVVHVRYDNYGWTIGSPGILLQISIDGYRQEITLNNLRGYKMEFNVHPFGRIEGNTRAPMKVVRTAIQDGLINRSIPHYTKEGRNWYGDGAFRGTV